MGESQRAFQGRGDSQEGFAPEALLCAVRLLRVDIKLKKRPKGVFSSFFSRAISRRDPSYSGGEMAHFSCLPDFPFRGTSPRPDSPSAVRRFSACPMRYNLLTEQISYIFGRYL